MEKPQQRGKWKIQNEEKPYSEMKQSPQILH